MVTTPATGSFATFYEVVASAVWRATAAERVLVCERAPSVCSAVRPPALATGTPSNAAFCPACLLHHAGVVRQAHLAWKAASRKAHADPHDFVIEQLHTRHRDLALAGRIALDDDRARDEAIAIFHVEADEMARYYCAHISHFGARCDGPACVEAYASIYTESIDWMVGHSKGNGRKARRSSLLEVFSSQSSQFLTFRDCIRVRRTGNGQMTNALRAWNIDRNLPNRLHMPNAIDQVLDDRYLDLLAENPEAAQLSDQLGIDAGRDLRDFIQWLYIDACQPRTEEPFMTSRIAGLAKAPKDDDTLNQFRHFTNIVDTWIGDEFAEVSAPIERARQQTRQNADLEHGEVTL